ncbi:MAG: universal stress protein [Verrucomicrobia bacterium]|nr:universal stress protein [Verrucomicrobiota bacterium]
MKNILVPIDFSEATPKVVECAEGYAKAFGASITLLHVAAPDPAFVGYEPGPQTVRDSVAGQIREEHRQIQDWEEHLRSRGVSASGLLVQGTTVDKILKEAESIGVDLIILGSHGHGTLFELLVGSVTEGVMRKAECPVLVVPTRG